MSTMHKHIRRVVADQCINYYSHLNSSDYCCLYDKKCIMFEAEIEQCRYLQESVLPSPCNGEVKELYYKHFEAKANNDSLSKTKVKSILAKNIKTCERCNSEFKAIGNRNRYCERCRKIIQTEK